MSKWGVNVRAVYIEHVEVEANTEEEAILFVQQGYGRTNRWLSEFGYRLPSNTWTVVKNPHIWVKTPDNKGHYPKGAQDDWEGEL